MTTNKLPMLGTNEVTISGLVTGAPSATGDVMRFALDIHDDSGRKSTVDCVTTIARCRKTLEGVRVGTRLHVCGQLQRRFWRSSQGVASRIVVVVTTVRKMR